MGTHSAFAEAYLCLLEAFIVMMDDAVACQHQQEAEVDHAQQQQQDHEMEEEE